MADEYSGPLTRPETPKIYRDAYRAWYRQRQRCNSPKKDNYIYYGAKGIRVEYSAREFCNWYVKERSKFPANSQVVVGRIDHDKNYCFGNVELITASENTKDVHRRHGRNLGFNQKPLLISDAQSNEPLMVFPNARVAAVVIGCSFPLLSLAIHNRIKTAKGFRVTLWQQ